MPNPDQHPQPRVWEDATAVTNYLDIALPDRTADRLKYYIRSALLDRRHELNLRTGRVEPVVLTHGRQTFQRWVPPGALLPPAEYKVLKQMLSAAAITVHHGGTGSGKSSCLTYLTRFFESIGETRDWKNPLGVRNFFIRLDLKDFGDEFKRRRSTPELRAEQREDFFKKIRLRVDQALERFPISTLRPLVLSLMSPEVLQEPVAEDVQAIEYVRELAVKSDAVYELRQEALQAGGIEIDKKLPPQQWGHLAAIIDRKLSAQMSKFRLRVILLHQLATLLEKLDELPLFLLIDNVDELLEDLQDAVIQELKTSTPLELPESLPGRASNLRICVFTRLSTSVTFAAAFAKAGAERVPYPSPNPADIIFWKLTDALLEGPENEPRFQSLAKEDQAKLLGRMWFVWGELSCRQSRLQGVVAARSGTNIRIAADICRNWLLSSRIRTIKYPSSAPAIRERLPAAMAIRLADALAREFLEWQGQKERLFEDPQALLTTCGNAVISAGRFGHPLHPETFGTDHDARVKSLRLFEDQLTALGASEEGKALLGTCRSHLSIVLPGEIRKFLATIEPEELVGELLNLSDSNNRAFYETIVGILPLAGRSPFEQASSTRARRGQRQLPSFLSAPITEGLRSQLELHGNLPSRWLSASVAVSPTFEYKACEFSAVNLFSDRGFRLFPAPLQILALLQERGAMRTSEVKEQLINRGYGDTDLRYSVEQMVSTNHRLIYSGIKDEATDLEWWDDSKSRLNISAAGTKYLTQLTRYPSYIQWCLLQLSDTAQEGAIHPRDLPSPYPIERIGAVLHALSLAIEADWDRYYRYLEDGEEELYARGFIASSLPTLGALLNCLPAFLHDLSVNRMRPDALSQRAHWLRLAESSLARFEEEIGPAPDQWTEAFLVGQQVAADFFADRSNLADIGLLVRGRESEESGEPAGNSSR